VPASYFAACHGKRVLIVTANISLTEQLAEKDLPTLASILPWKFTYGLLKGKQNYLCVDKLADLRSKQYGNSYEYQKLLELDSAEEQLDSILEWANRVEETGLGGDKSELDFEPIFPIWNELSVSGQECKGSKCPEYKTCVAVEAQKKARQANVIITNYHMLFLHLAFADEEGMSHVLPSFDIAILDECHKAADIARDCFGFKITEGAFRRIAKRSIGRGHPTGLHLTNAAQGFFATLAEYRRKSDYRTRLKVALSSYRGYGMADSWAYFNDAILQAKKTLAREQNILEGKLSILLANDAEVALARGFLPGMPVETPVAEEQRTLARKKSDIEAGYARLSELHEELTRIVTLREYDEEDRYVSFIEFDEKQRIMLVRKPVHVGPILRRTLFERTRNVICTSATLAVDGKFKYARTELGCDEATEIISESPFDYRKQVLLIVPDGLPSPKDEDNFPDALADNIRKTIDLAGGRTLVLFTSRRSMHKTYNHKLIRESEHRILCQDELPPARLAAEFRDDTKSVLFGLERFWAGLDVVGESLSVVVIEKLPFPTPDDPVLDVLSEGKKDAFFKYSIPRAVISFKQGVGRLIRSASDRGVIVILDRRVIDMNYGQTFLRSLPPMNRPCRDLNQIRSFLRSPSEMSDDEYYASVFGDDE
jgi:ATP-dependent DNA helicase DinG